MGIIKYNILFQNLYSSLGASNLTTSSINPTPGRIVLAIIGNNSSVNGATTPALSGGGASSWTQLTTRLNSFLRKRVTLSYALLTSSGSGGVIVDFGGQTQTDVWVMLIELYPIVSTGINGTDALGQNGSNESGTIGVTSLNISLGAFANINDATIAAILITGTTPSVPSGFTRISSMSGFYIDFADTNQTSITWSFSNEASIAGLATEIKASLGGAAGLFPVFL